MKLPELSAALPRAATAPSDTAQSQRDIRLFRSLRQQSSMETSHQPVPLRAQNPAALLMLLGLSGLSSRNRTHKTHKKPVQEKPDTDTVTKKHPGYNSGTAKTGTGTVKTDTGKMNAEKTGTDKTDKCGKTRPELPHPSRQTPADGSDTPARKIKSGLHRRKPELTDDTAAAAPFSAPLPLVQNHLQIRRTAIITRISDTLTAHITHTARPDGSHSRCDATFPALGAVHFDIVHKPDGIQILIQCAEAGRAFLQSGLPQLHERLAQKLPQHATITLSSRSSSAAAPSSAAVRSR